MGNQLLAKDKILYLIKKERGGEILYKNFKSVYFENNIREKIGDFDSLLFSNLHNLSIIYSYPMAIYEIYRTGKLLGYYSILEIEKNLSSEIIKNSTVWEILKSKEIIEKQKFFLRNLK